MTDRTTLTGAGALVVDDGRMLLVLDQWAARGTQPFQVHVDISVNPDGTQSYAVRR